MINQSYPFKSSYILLLLIISLANCLKFHYNNKTLLKQNLSFINFIYPYEIFQVFNSSQYSSSIVMQRINPLFASNQQLYKYLQSLPETISFFKTAKTNLMKFRKISQSSFLIQEQISKAKSSEDEEGKKNEEKGSEKQNNMNKISENLDKLTRNLDKLNSQMKQIDTIIQSFPTNLELNEKRLFSSSSSSSDTDFQRQFSFFTIDINYYIFLTHQINFSALEGQRKVYHNFMKKYTLPTLNNYESKIDISNNGSTHRFILFEQFEKGDNANLVFNFSLMDKGFDQGHEYKFYEARFLNNMFSNQIIFMKIFPVDFGIFYLLTVDKQYNLTLFETSTGRLNLLGKKKLHVEIFFIDIFTLEMPLQQNSSNSIFVSYVGFIDDNLLIFSVISSPLVKQEVGERIGNKSKCEISLNVSNIENIQKLNNELVVMCTKGSDQQWINCEIIDIYCSSFGFIKDIPANYDRKWKIFQNPLDQQQQIIIELYLSSLSNQSFSQFLFNRFHLINDEITNKQYLQYSNQQIEHDNLGKNRILEEKKEEENVSSLLSKYSFFSRYMQNFDNFTFQSIQNTTKSIIEGWQNIFMPEDAYKNIDQYKYIKGSRLLQSNLKHILYQQESVTQQQNNCVLEQKAAGDNLSPVAISFPKNSADWKFCRVAVKTDILNYMLLPNFKSVDEFDYSKPYKIYICGMAYSNFRQKCEYKERQVLKSIYLNPKNINILFIENNGQTYDIIIKDISQHQLQKVTAVFIYILFTTFLIFFVFFLAVITKPFCLYCLIILRLTRRQPHYVFPLNYISLKMRLTIMKQRFLIEERYASENEEIDDCGFCLEEKRKNGEPLIQVYCKHSFHQSCFMEWIRQESRLNNTACPICKRKISSEGRQRFQEQLRTDQKILNESEGQIV